MCRQVAVVFIIYSRARDTGNATSIKMYCFSFVLACHQTLSLDVGDDTARTLLMNKNTAAINSLLAGVKRYRDDDRGDK